MNITVPILLLVLSGYLILAEEYATEPELVCEKGGFCHCGIGNDNLTYVNCKKASMDALTTAPLETAWISVKTGNPFKAQLVDLSYNSIRSLTKDKIVPGHEPTIVKLDASYNFIEVIDDGAFDTFEELEVLVLSHNRLLAADVNKNWLTSKVDKLHQLYLDNNRIGVLEAGTFDNMQSLTKLVLDHNNLTITNKTFGTDLANLRTLSLDYCNISQLDENVFAHLIGLEELSLIGNPLSVFPAVLDHLPQLTILDLSETDISELADGLKHENKLERLFMKNLKYLWGIEECAFCRLSSLKQIDFSGSKQLYSIHEGAFGALKTTEDWPTHLTDISFANCKLSTLSKTMLKWENVERLNIGGNPFNCDCHLQWIITEPKYQHFVGDEVPRCSEPEELNGTTLQRAADYVCGGPNKAATTGELFLLILVLFALSSTVLAVVFFASGQRRITNVFYRPDLPQMGYSNLNANGVDATEDDHHRLDDDFIPKPEAV